MIRSALLLVFTLFLLEGCGYRPSAHYAKAVVGERISTQVVVSLEDPENTVVIKDAIDRAVLTRFKSTISDRERADTHLVFGLENIVFTPLRYDVNGYIITYQTRLVLNVVRMTKNYSKAYRVQGNYDFTIEPNAIISDQARFQAIEVSAQKAIDSFLAQVASEGLKRNK